MNEKVHYIKERSLKEEHVIEIEDINNCYFEGRSKYDGTKVYKGIYFKDGRQHFVVIRQPVGGWIIDVHDTCFSANTVDVKSFFETYGNCQQISEIQFFDLLNEAVAKLGRDYIII